MSGAGVDSLGCRGLASRPRWNPVLWSVAEQHDGQAAEQESDPQSEPDTRDSPSSPASGGHRKDFAAVLLDSWSRGEHATFRPVGACWAEHTEPNVPVSRDLIFPTPVTLSRRSVGQDAGRGAHRAPHHGLGFPKNGESRLSSLHAAHGAGFPGRHGPCRGRSVPAEELRSRPSPAIFAGGPSCSRTA